MSYQFKFDELNNEFYLKVKQKNSIYFPNEAGSIHTVTSNINDDILLVKEDMYAFNDLKMEAEFGSNNSLLIGLILEGSRYIYDSRNNTTKKEGQNNINIIDKKNENPLYIMDKDTQTKSIGILIKESFWEENLFCHLKDEKRLAIERDIKENITTIYKSSLASFKTLSLAKEIYNSPFIGTLNNLYLQSKVYEIIHNEFLDIINEDNKPKQNKIILSQEDIEALYKAKELILENKKHFSLDELSKKVALNQTKLKYGFKQLFHTTPGNIMLEARMYEAKRLLETSEYNVTEIAQLTGYKYIQNFTKAFIKFFGTSPSEIMKSRTYYY